MVHELNKNNSILNNFIAELRDVKIQNDRMRFRRNLERVGEIIAYEISKELNFQPVNVKTPLGVSNENLVVEQPVLITILRAGLPLHIGLLNYFDQADNAFVSAYRKPKGDDFEIKIEYLASPNLDNRIVILNDPMLATGGSLVLAYEAIKKMGTPKAIHIASVIASKKGVEYAQKKLPSNTQLWIAAIDDELNDKAYIVPGLGDAGDLAFGSKE